MGKKIWIDVSERGRAGGKARALAMTAQEKSDAARRAVTIRWDRVRAAKLAAAKSKRKSARKKVAA
jgi:hypothetical protein